MTWKPTNEFRWFSRKVVNPHTGREYREDPVLQQRWILDGEATEFVWRDVPTVSGYE